MVALGQKFELAGLSGDTRRILRERGVCVRRNPVAVISGLRNERRAVVDNGLNCWKQVAGDLGF